MNNGSQRNVHAMSVLVLSDPLFLEHDAGPGHPERPERLAAVLAGVADAGVPVGAATRRATRAELERVHDTAYLDALDELAARGGGRIDADTRASERSFEAALLGAGAGLEAIDALEQGVAESAFVAVRPPGHHALAARGMGFCLVNNIAIAAAALVAAGQRVLIVDWDAHHGNGTQDIFWTSDSVLFVSLHEWPLYPGTGRLAERGGAAGEGTTLNFPLPSGATGDVYLEAFDGAIAAAVDSFEPGWVLVSAGYDAHRADPLTGLGLAAGDYSDLTSRVMALAPTAGRLVCFLEGGYDLAALRASVHATVSTLAGGPVRPEASTSGGPGRDVVAAAARLLSA
jgi:acetoin utilization deacetylase AcuC-like enzyme